MIKYRNIYISPEGSLWRVDISNEDYEGDIIPINTTEGTGCKITYANSEDPFEPVKNSTASFTVLNQDSSSIDVAELKNSADRDWSVDVYKDDVLFWTGWLVPNGIQEAIEGKPYNVPLTATDGLKLLTTAMYTTANYPLPDSILQRSVISHLRDILFRFDQNGKPLPIRWSGVLEQYRGGVDPNRNAFTEVRFSPRGEAYTDFNGNKFSSYYIMENLLRAMQCRIYQCEGKWRIDRIPDIRTGYAIWTEMSATFDGVSIPTLTSGVETRLSNIGSDYILLPGAYTLNLPGVKKVTVTYEAQQPENVLPNGDFDNTGISAPRYWFPSNADLNATQVGSLNKRDGYAMELSFPMNMPGSGRTEYFALYDGEAGPETPLPFDSQVMFKRMSLGFTLQPQNGFPYNGDGIIQWEEYKPFRFRIELANGDEIFTLNENGFWIPIPTGGNFTRYSVNWYIDAMKFYAEWGFEGNVIVGDYLHYHGTPDPGDDFDFRCFVPTQFSNDLEGFLDYAGQWFVDNSFMTDDINKYIKSYEIIPDGTGKWILKCEIAVGDDYVQYLQMDAVESATERDGAIVLLPGPSMIDDIIQINFDKFQGVILPDFKEDSGYEYATLNWFFYVKQGQRYTIDDVYVKFDENNEVYEYEYPTKFTEKLEYVIKISSSVNGLYPSNIMDVYYTSPVDEPYTDATAYIGNLTDMTARTIARYRSKSLEMFEGSMLGQGAMGGMYTVEGIPDKVLMPVGMSINTETSQVQLTAVELDEGGTSFTRKFYGSNDKPLSNEVIN